MTAWGSSVGTVTFQPGHELHYDSESDSQHDDVRASSAHLDKVNAGVGFVLLAALAGGAVCVREQDSVPSMPEEEQIALTSTVLQREII